MKKQIHGETVRFTKSGEVNKQDRFKVAYAYMLMAESATRGWEFEAMMDGIQSPRANARQAQIDFFKAICQQAQLELVG